MFRTLSIAAALLFIASSFAVAEDNDGWTTVFDGKSFKGWKASENKDSWKIEDGALVCHGPRSHLFYIGDGKPFVNFGW